MLSNEYLVAKFGFDTEENEPLKVWGVIQFIIQSSPYWCACAALLEEGIVAPIGGESAAVIFKEGIEY